MDRKEITRLRFVLGWSQAGLARALGVDVKTIWRWEAGRATPIPRHESQLVRLMEQQLGTGTEAREGAQEAACAHAVGGKHR